MTFGGFVNVPENQFTFAPGIGRAHDFRDPLGTQDLLDDLELVPGLLIDHERPSAGQHRERGESPLFPGGIDLVRLSQRCQVPDGPRNHIATAVKKSIAFLAGAQDAGDVSCNRRLFSQNGDGAGRHSHPSIITGSDMVIV